MTRRGTVTQREPTDGPSRTWTERKKISNLLGTLSSERGGGGGEADTKDINHRPVTEILTASGDEPDRFVAMRLLYFDGEGKMPLHGGISVGRFGQNTGSP